VKHGGWGYAYDQGCRCDECVQAHNDHHRELRARRAQGRPEDNPNLKHGTRSTYGNHGCRCSACFQAQADWNRARPSRAKPR
jgi:hypothetical protein